MNELDLMSPSKVAETYGGDKVKIANAVKLGLVNPTVGVMAGMFIDRMRSAAVQEQAPQTTVAQDVLTPPAPMQMPMGMPQQAPAGLQAAAAAPMQSGLAALPVDESMIPGGEGYADGGIVAFANGDFVQDGMFSLTAPEMGPMTRRDLVEKLSLPELQIYNRTGKLPERLRSDLGGRAIESAPIFGNVPLTTNTPEFLPYTVPTAAPAAAAAAASPVPAPTAKAPAAPKAKKDEGVAAAPVGPQGVEGYLSELQRVQKAAGVSPDPFGEDRSTISDLRQRLAQERSDAGSMALIEAGLGIMGGGSQYALQNIGEGAKGAVSSYAKALRQVKEDEKEYGKIERDLTRAEQAFKRGDVDKAFELRSQAEDRALRLRATIAQEKSASRPSQFQEQYAAYQADPKKFQEFRGALTSSDEGQALNRLRYADAALANDLDYMRLARSNKPEDQQKAAQMRQNVYARYGVTPSTAGGGVKFLGFE